MPRKARSRKLEQFGYSLIDRVHVNRGIPTQNGRIGEEPMAQDFETVLYRKSDGIAEIRLNRPHRHEASLALEDRSAFFGKGLDSLPPIACRHTGKDGFQLIIQARVVGARTLVV